VPPLYVRRLKMKITRFSPIHAHRCMEIFLTNQGRFFDPSEMPMLRSFLENDSLTEEFYVIVEDELVIGCGGLEWIGDGQVNLTWGNGSPEFSWQRIWKSPA